MKNGEIFKKMISKLQYISQGRTTEEQLKNIQQALDAGCEWIQCRYKDCEAKELIELALKIKKHCSFYNAVFILNDHPEIAKQVNVDGVHLGLMDMKISEARKIVGDKIIGGTANTLEDVLNRVEEKCDYIGLGPFRFTSTKEKLSPVLGLEGYKKIMDELDQREITVPVFAIGGILAEDAPAILETGVHGIAVSGLITNHADKKELIAQLNKYFYEHA